MANYIEMFRSNKFKVKNINDLRNSMTIDIDAQVFPSGVFPDDVPARTVFKRNQQEGSSDAEVSQP